MNGLTDWMNAHAKAIVAGLTTALYLYFQLRSDGLSAGDIEAIIFAALTAGGATWAIPNIDPVPKLAVVAETMKVDVAHTVTQASGTIPTPQPVPLGSDEAHV
jgi:hypothetical protein